MLITENLYLGAYALLNGAALQKINVSRSNGRTTAVFEIASPHADKLSDEFYQSTAIVNLGEYREHLERLKDELFATLKKHETERRDHETYPRPRRHQHARL